MEEGHQEVMQGKKKERFDLKRKVEYTYKLIFEILHRVELPNSGVSAVY